MDENFNCPDFSLEKFDYQKIIYKDKLFAKQRVISFFHIPLAFRWVLQNLTKKIETSLAKDPEQIMLVDANSLWGADLMLSVTGNVKDAEMIKITGVFLTRVFEGPHRNIRKWIKEMNEYVKSQNESVKKLYFYHVTCPKSNKKSEYKYTVIFAKI